MPGATVWPTVAEARSTLGAAGYGLFKGTKDGQTHWTGATPSTSPIELIGEDGEPVRIIVSIGVNAIPSKAIDDVASLLQPGDRGIIDRAVGSAASHAVGDDVSRGALADGDVEVHLDASLGTLTVCITPRT